MPIEIREARPEDAPAIQAIYAPIVAGTAISFEEIPPTIEEMRQRIVTTLQTYPYLVAMRDGRLVGYAYASQHRARAAYRWAVDVTVYIAESERRSGVGRRLYAELLPILTKQGFNAAYAGIALPNAGSVGLHELLGFRHIGTFPQVGFKLGQWHDVGYWRLELGSPSGSPRDPRRYPDIAL
ncbi:MULTISPECIES: arsinothricin resistance N-acetyltransferase ArsN1 family B [unclassified Pseudomonas]|uniref:arsinothricin resistance N-acetyltransferase ArsN1 family B n=1 Tax=unclassified Pseudomonas TaxID=196821 RepID=UPI0007316120|nr:MULTISPECIES: arsinothricin resistance N-acetyltransferase ArsN1 family B [unclassified Pseudomonas]KSW24223.1 acetyltransferase [Pseudomonas sp. ADP]OBP07751.1 acetyltransferase [Pseudomonas sp. EGD-AKN5]QOF86759.1 N-acetyltransferase [Pseudomonas sp. ADPe]